MFKPFTVIVSVAVLFMMIACTRHDAPLDSAKQVSLSSAQIENENVPADQPVESDSDEPTNVAKQNFIKAFVGRLEQGAPVAGLMVPVLDFAYYKTDRCGGSTRMLIPDLDTAKIDTPFKIGTLYSANTADCKSIPDKRTELIFDLKMKLSEWDRFEAAADDHNYESFYLAGRDSTEHMMVYIVKRSDRYEIFRLEYHIQTPAE